MSYYVVMNRPPRSDYQMRLARFRYTFANGSLHRLKHELWSKELFQIH